MPRVLARAAEGHELSQALGAELGQAEVRTEALRAQLGRASAAEAKATLVASAASAQARARAAVAEARAAKAEQRAAKAEADAAEARAAQEAAVARAAGLAVAAVGRVAGWVQPDWGAQTALAGRLAEVSVSSRFRALPTTDLSPSAYPPPLAVFHSRTGWR